MFFLFKRVSGCILIAYNLSLRYQKTTLNRYGCACYDSPKMTEKGFSPPQAAGF